MSKKRYYILSVIFLLLSVYVLYIKGYFSVRSFNVNRSDIEDFLNSQDTTELKDMFTVDKNVLEGAINKNFSDVENIYVYKDYLNFKIKVEVKSREALFKTQKPNYYIDKNGVLFSSARRLNTEEMPEVDVSSVEGKNKVFESGDIKFITLLKDYPNIKIVFKEHYYEIRLKDNYSYYIEVYGVLDGEKVAEHLSAEISTLDPEEKGVVFLVLDNKIIVKK